MKLNSPEALELCLHDALFRTVELLFAGSEPVRTEHRQMIQDMTSSLATELRNLAFVLTPATLQNHTATVATESVAEIQQTQQEIGPFALTTMFQAVGAGINHHSTPLMLLIVATALGAYVGLDRTAGSLQTQLLIPSPLTAREAALIALVSCVERSQAFPRLEGFPSVSKLDWNYALRALDKWVIRAYENHRQVLQQHATIAREQIQVLTVREFSPSAILDIMLRKALLRGAEDVEARGAPDNVSLLLALQTFKFGTAAKKE